MSLIANIIYGIQLFVYVEINLLITIVLHNIYNSECLIYFEEIY